MCRAILSSISFLLPSSAAVCRLSSTRPCCCAGGLFSASPMLAAVISGVRQASIDSCFSSLHYFFIPLARLLSCRDSPAPMQGLSSPDHSSKSRFQISLSDLSPVVVDATTPNALRSSVRQSIQFFSRPPLRACSPYRPLSSQTARASTAPCRPSWRRLAPTNRISLRLRMVVSTPSSYTVFSRPALYIIVWRLVVGALLLAETDDLNEEVVVGEGDSWWTVSGLAKCFFWRGVSVTHPCSKASATLALSIRIFSSSSSSRSARGARSVLS